MKKLNILSGDFKMRGKNFLKRILWPLNLLRANRPSLGRALSPRPPGAGEIILELADFAMVKTTLPRCRGRGGYFKKMKGYNLPDNVSPTDPNAPWNQGEEEEELRERQEWGMVEWKKGKNNYILEGDGFYISYNSAPWGGVFPMFAADNNSDETALCIEKGDQILGYILNGDFRKDYEQVVNQGLNACMEIYKKYKKKYNSSWSTK